MNDAKPEKFIVHCPNINEGVDWTCATFDGKIVNEENKHRMPPHNNSCQCFLVPIKSQADYNNETLRCNNGHKSRRLMWECPICVEAIIRENHELKADLALAHNELKEARLGLGLPSKLIKHIDHVFLPDTKGAQMSESCHEVVRQCYAYFKHLNMVLEELHEKSLKRK